MRSPATKSIEDFSRFLHAQLAPSGMTLLVVACDESGKLNDSAIVAFSGLVTSDAGIAKFAEDWGRKLRQSKIPYLSMKDALRLEGPFAGWENKKEERDEVLRSFARLVKEVPRFSAPMPTHEFRALSPEQRKKLGGDVQYCGFEIAIKGVLNSYPGASVHLVCDLSEQYSEKCVSLYNDLRKKNTEAKARCVALTFADDKVHPPLQAADMVAYCSRINAMRHSITVFPIIVRIPRDGDQRSELMSITIPK